MVRSMYDAILDAPNLVSEFKDYDEFKSWCECGELIDLTEFLNVLVVHELYEHCAIVRDVINEKVNDVSESN